VLDAACGTGYGSRILLERGAATSVDGFDVSPEAIAEAQRTSECPGLRFAVGDACRFDLPTAAYDVFVSLETIEHIEDDAAYVREARRVVRPGGVFLCSTPNRLLGNPGRSLADAPWNPFHVREYVRDELTVLLRSAFHQVDLLGQTPFDARYARALAVLGARLPMAAVRLHQARKVLGIPWEHRARHAPRLLPLAGAMVTEILIAVCR
jgi:SAM-dependent methyltransferase